MQALATARAAVRRDSRLMAELPRSGDVEIERHAVRTTGRQVRSVGLHLVLARLHLTLGQASVEPVVYADVAGRALSAVGHHDIELNAVADRDLLGSQVAD